MTNKEYLSPPEVAKELGVNAGKVLAWIRRHELLAVNLNRLARSWED
jgi:hypothetical protein